MQDADLAVINGVLHHLDGQQATTTRGLARKALKPRTTYLPGELLSLAPVTTCPMGDQS